MNKSRFILQSLAVAFVMIVAASATHAQATRTWVSGVGDDANPCSRTAPCKTFAGAISKTAAGGEINALDPGGFGGLTINKAITIDGGGGQVASVLVSGTNGITVNAGASDVITLNNLRFQGIAGGTGLAGTNGIRFIAGKTLNVINCVIYGFSQNGIDIAVGATASVYVHNTVVKNCAGDGLAASASAGQVKVAIDTSSFEGCGNGLHAKFNSRVSADRCNFSNNSNNGVFADGTSGVGVANITNSSVYNNDKGVQAANTGVARINNCDIIQNFTNGVLVGAGSEVDTWGNNRIIANGTIGCPSCTPVGFN